MNLPAADPSSAGMSAERLAQMDSIIKKAIEHHDTPGAVVLVGRHGKVVWRKAYGSRALEPAPEPMTTDTIFDLASLTKVVATATSIMIMVERGLIRLSDPVTTYIPELKGKERITIDLLLTHRSGYAPDFDLSENWSGYDEAMKRLYREPLRREPGERFAYSDINYIALGEVIRRVSGQTLDEFARQNIYEPLKMSQTRFRPAPDLAPKIAPTEKLSATMRHLGGRDDNPANNSDHWLRGEVHDPTAYRMGGVAGHAGLFSTADDLAVFCQMILNGGEYAGVRVLSPMAVAAMTRPRAVGPDGQARGLGWDIATNYSSNRGDLFPLGSFGHTGFTGTSIWIDPASDTFVIFLSNRVHPNGKGDVGPLRGRIASIVASSILDETAKSANESSARFANLLLVDLARISNPRGAAETSSPVDAEVLTGIDVLEQNGIEELRGMQVGLVTNHTGLDRLGRPTIDVLNTAPGVKLVALFAPEHGIRGLADEKVSDTKDERTGLPVYSLYGETRRPAQEQLKALNAIVYDIQDVGTRFYTYMATLGYVMEEASKAHLPVYVLDRPNPIGGLQVEGPIADADKLSFTAYHRIPVRHGMTIGELARLFNDERKLGCDLRVIKMQNYRRTMWFDATGLKWVNPSPNMRSLAEATLYPGLGLLETTNLSVGRGTDTPFEVAGAPYIDGRRLARYLNELRLAGVRFVPVEFTPSASVFKGEHCGGVNILVVDRAVFRPVATGVEIAAALHNLYPRDWKVDGFARLIANSDAFERLKRGEKPEEIVRAWLTSLETFQLSRTKALLYE
jgi:uncharacterized protein YbbC (DUF1343 family)